MFRRIYLEEEGFIKQFEEFYDERSMASSRLHTISSEHPWGWITVKEYKDDSLIRSYEYFSPSESKIINFNAEEDIVTYNNGLRINGKLFNFIQSMKMSVILGEEVPHSVVHRAISLFHPDHWYINNEYPGTLDKISCDFQYVAKIDDEATLHIFFGFMRIKEHPEDINLVWKFNSVLMFSKISKISGHKKTFGPNCFQDIDFERLTDHLGVDGIKKFMSMADKGDDMAIAEALGLKPCDYTSIFTLCDDSCKGIFV
jgi:hypothetical protein